LYAKYALISGRLCSIFASRGSTMDGIGIGSALAGDVVLGCELVRRENLESVPRRMTSGYWHCPPKIRFIIQVRRFEHTSAPIRQHPPHFGFCSSHLTYRSFLASLCQHCQCCGIPLTRLRLQIYPNPRSVIVTACIRRTTYEASSLDPGAFAGLLIHGYGNRKADMNEQDMYGMSRSRETSVGS
jgi:hypothetical protein